MREYKGRKQKETAKKTFKWHGLVSGETKCFRKRPTKIKQKKREAEEHPPKVQNIIRELANRIQVSWEKGRLSDYNGLPMIRRSVPRRLMQKGIIILPLRQVKYLDIGRRPSPRSQRHR